MKRLFSTITYSCLCISPALAAKPNMIIQFSAPDNSAEQVAKQQIEASGINQTVIELSNQSFPFNKTLTIQYGGTEGPLYDPDKHTIYIPYRFYQESLSYFQKNKYEEKFQKSAQLGAIDTLLHTLLHEAGHAFIADQDIAILGKEEDAVDNFATILMLNYVDQGDDAAISAADMFAFESDDRPDYYDFGEYIDEHSFDLQRYFSTLCLVYGSDPEKHQALLDEVENDYLTDRKDFCTLNYDQINDNWHRYFHQNIK
ncbi:DUF4344 domain-containing metallopeptidase [Vibrio cortegadensis]|uniref:DUF4344 domain-containing metallopeptidase n=1 Tax=Vibrio cortegadensis TaxID=1328770 RepID=UPI00352FB657